MIITCANCDTSYELNENLIKEAGSKVRCKNCSHVFMVYPPKTLESIEPEPDLELERVVDEPESPVDSQEPSLETEADITGETDSLHFPDIEGMLDEEAKDESESINITEDEPELSLVSDADEEAAIGEFTEGQSGDDLDFLDLSDVEDMLVGDVDVGLEDINVTDEEPELSLEETSDGENLDLSEIEDMLDVDKGPTLAELEKSQEDQELELSSEPGFDPITGVAENLLPDTADELDLSDIEKMLDDETATAAGSDSVKITGDEPELSLEPTEDAESPTAYEKTPEESLDFDLDMELGTGLEKETTAEDTSQDLVFDEELSLDDDVSVDEELNLDEEISLDPEELEELDLELEDSDIFLEEEDLQLDMERDLELELDTDEDLLLGVDVEGDDDVLLEVEEGDLLLEPEEPELDLILEPEDEEEGFEIDLEEDEEVLVTEEVPGDVDFELDLDELEDHAEAEEMVAPAKAAGTISSEEAFAMGAEAEQAVRDKPVSPPVPVPQKKSRALTYFLLVALFLVGGAYGGVYYFKQKGMEIEELPYIGTLFAKPGEIVTNEATWKQEFYENANAGSLLVITGNVENKFSHPRSYISVIGELLSASQNVIKTETVFCGNVLEKSELETAKLADIKKQLKKRGGNKNSNVNVKPGGKVPFMVVFTNLPENAKEFRVKIVGSEDAGK